MGLTERLRRDLARVILVGLEIDGVLPWRQNAPAPTGTRPSTITAISMGSRMSAPSVLLPQPANRVERALGITDRHGWLLAWWQALVVGSVFVIVSLIGYHSPHPRHVPVAVTGPAAVTRQVEARVDAAAPGAYRFHGFGSTAQAGRALRRGQVYAIVDLTGTPTIRYAGAQGPTVFAALVRDVVPPVAAATRSSPALVDALPLGGDDAAALPLFYLCFAVVLSSYLFSITTTTQARRLRAWGHWTSAAALAVSLGLIAALVARFGTHTISAHTATVALVLMLTSLATGATSYLLLRLSSTFGSILGTVVLVILGSASGGVVPGQFLPPLAGRAAARAAHGGVTHDHPGHGVLRRAPPVARHRRPRAVGRGAAGRRHGAGPSPRHPRAGARRGA